MTQSIPDRRLHLNVGINTTGYLGNAWKYARLKPRDVTDIQHYLRLARLAHKGVFDAVFLSDMPLLRPDPASRPLHTFDPLILLTAIAASVPDIGLVATVSSTYNSPYNLARRAQTLDLISGGRLILNIVSNFVPEVAANFGNDPLPPRDVRYPRAEEFLEVAKKLWSSWDWDAEGEKPEGQFWDTNAVEPIAHDGEYFAVRGALNVPRSRQGHPVIAQAGGSDRGIDLAARHGEIIYCNILSRGAGQAFRQRVTERAIAAGRDPSEIRLTPGLVAIIGESREEALRKHELFSGAGSEDGLLVRFTREHGIDPHDFDPDAPLDVERFIPDPGRITAIGFTQGLVDLLTHERLTARQVVRRAEGNHRLILGTAEEIADQIIDLWADGTVDGYTYQPPRAPDDIEEFVDKVIPILQDRGVYPTAYDDRTVRERFGLPHPAARARPSMPAESLA
ncbi:NtaA/DmoA family FMN-dependent monooxygenase [Novosphingobium guangzhouense]|uniref:Nitrilotriacetate monooxygenase n=1 Tax=Novosphingobium guangzhouense TaxID=1850347 RepID=A0A2K2G3B3_9SPHN|nr:NtaA/DmoA family FMN-dependent monooxygenase [Novosphingobium guangzhouense]PNU05524.1 nitrilotriacetate monooxygenase [Novosphingobium guangzhouense]